MRHAGYDRVSAGEKRVTSVMYGLHPRVARCRHPAPAPLSSAEDVASRLAILGTIARNEKARSGADPGDRRWPTTAASNRFGVARQAASASSTRVNPTGS